MPLRRLMYMLFRVENSGTLTLAKFAPDILVSNKYIRITGTVG